MKVSEITRENITDDIINRLLFDGFDDIGENGDLIMVLGSLQADTHRVPKAVEIYFSGRCNKMLFAGGKVRNFTDGRAKEAEKMLEKALSLNVPRDNIYLEDSSESTVENIKNSAQMIRKNMPECKKILLVTVAYHQCRATKIAQKLLGDYKIIPCPANFGSTRKDNWYKSEKGRRTALDECLKFGYYIINDYIDDFEI